MARLAGGLWALGRGVQPLSPLGTAWHLAPTLGTLPGWGVPPGPPPLCRCHDRARPSARRGSVKKNGGDAAQALGRSRGGLSTKIHAGCRDARTSVAVVLTPGHWHESPVFATVFAQVPPTPPLTHGIMDKGYDSMPIREQLLAHDMVPVIPPRSNRTAPIDYDHDLYKLREQVERFFNHLKQFRRIATRYDKLSRTFLAFIHLVAAWIMLK
jgi:transposase